MYGFDYDFAFERQLLEQNPGNPEDYDTEILVLYALRTARGNLCYTDMEYALWIVEQDTPSQRICDLVDSLEARELVICGTCGTSAGYRTVTKKEIKETQKTRAIA